MLPLQHAAVFSALVALAAALVTIVVSLAAVVSGQW
jgi:hypothetical protein